MRMKLKYFLNNIGEQQMYLGVDLGTSSVKVIILDDNDTLIAQASAELTV